MSAVPHLYEAPPAWEPTADALPPLSVLDGGRNVEARLRDAERLTRRNRHVAALSLLEDLCDDVRHDPALILRHRLASSWAEMYTGRLEEASHRLEQAERMVQSPSFDAADRAAVLFRMGCIRLKQADVPAASTLFTRSLETNARSSRQEPAFAADVLNWRSRCHQLRRDWDAAGRDAEASHALATEARDEWAQANALFQISLIAERQRSWLLARCHAEQALEIYRRHDDLLSTARILNNLGGLDFLLGDVESAERNLLEAASLAGEAESSPDVAQAASSLAQVMLRSGRPQESRRHAEAALELLAGRKDFHEEIGNAQLVVAGAFAAELNHELATEWLDRAERTFVEIGARSPLAATCVARGDLERARGDVELAAELYRRAAESLQDFHF